MKGKLMMLLACLFMGASVVTAQNSKVTGLVISAEDSEPVIGATIAVKGVPTLGTITGLDGKFVLENVPSSAKTLVVSYVGMTTQEVTIHPYVKVVMQSDAEVLEDVLVVAYGTAKKESFTGSAAVVSNKKITARPVANVTKALEGMVAGVQTTSGSGQPGSGASVVIRGFGSINAVSTPLYVVDGVPYDGNISSINPNDIASMTILKDASAGALYGSRGANGVVMITTKKGEQGRTRVNLKANWGVASRSLPRYETMDEAGYLETVYQSYKNDLIYNSGVEPSVAAVQALQNMKSGATAILGQNEMYNPYNYSITELIDPTTGKVRSDAVLKYSEDWVDEAMQDNPLRQDYTATITSGNDKTAQMYSLGYVNEQGLLKTTQFTRINGRMNVDTQVNKWLKSGISANYARRSSNSAQENNSTSSNVWYTAELMAPIYPVFAKDADGNTLFDGLGNPVFDYGSSRPAGANADWNTIATLYDDRYLSESDDLSGRAYAELGNLKTGALQGLKLSVNYGFDLVNASSMQYYNPYNGNSVGVKGTIAKANGRTFSYTFNQLMSYDRKFGKHHVDVLAGHEFYKYNYQYLSATKTGFPFGGLYELDAASTITGASSYQDNYAVESVLSRASYDYADKYYLSGSYRRDGSSRFHKDSRWGNFWSVGGNWRVSQESFMKNVKWINNLSLKASYGVQGNDNLGSYYAWQSFYDLGWPNASMNGAALSSLESSDLRWEKNANLNTGIETRLFNRLNVSVEWYNRVTSDMLMSYPMATSLGFDGYNKNIGSMRNRGIDAAVAVEILKGNFNWTVSAMASTIDNKVLKLADKPEIISGSYIIREGETLNSFYTATAAGVDPATGKQLYWVWDEDENGVRSEKYITDDKAKATQCKDIQGSRIPDLYGSFSNEFRYKAFDLSVMCTYSLGGQILDGVYNTLLYGNYIGQAKSKHLERAWKQPGDITDIPRIEIGQSYPVTDNSLIDASYLAIKNITLGYTLPARASKAIGVQNMRLTATGDNLVMFSHLKGMNPQYNFTGGTNFGYVPTRTIAFGIDVTF